MPRISLVIPVYNEAESLPFLFEALNKAVGHLDHEIVLVNDGSRDKSTEVLREHAARDPKLKVIDFRRNFGQTAAINAGIQHATGDLLVPSRAAPSQEGGDLPDPARRSSHHSRWRGAHLPCWRCGGGRTRRAS